MRKFGLMLCISVISLCVTGSGWDYRYASIFSHEPIGTISSDTQVEITDGAINGEKAEYTFLMPNEWKNIVFVHREKLPYSMDILEKLKFYYQPMNIITQPVFLMSITVHDKNERWDNGIDILMESRKYAFGIQEGSSHNISDPMDMEKYLSVLDQVYDHEFLRSLIKLADDDEKILEYAIWVNGELLERSMIKDAGTIYLPLREACETMDYAIGWLEEHKAVSVARDKFYELVFTDYNPWYPGYSTIMVDDRVYVSSMFFIQKLKVSMEIDEYNNIYITE